MSDPSLGPRGRAALRSPGRSTVAGRPERAGRVRRLARILARRVAVLLALLILFYATSLHGVSIRTFVLAGLLVLSLYWIFKGAL